MPRKTFPIPPISHFVDLADLSHAGSLIELSATCEERARLARWADVAAVLAFAAKVTLRKLSPTRFSYAADLAADIEQRCVVTLEPVVAHIDMRFERELLYSSHPVADGGELTLSAGDDETPDTIDDLHFDIARPLLEELSLSIDPYPRKGDARFETPSETAEGPDSPFSVLKSLKKEG